MPLSAPVSRPRRSPLGASSPLHRPTGLLRAPLKALFGHSDRPSGKHRPIRLYGSAGEVSIAVLMTAPGQSVPMRTPLASYQVRNSLKADLVKRYTPSRTLRAKPVRPNAVSPANADWLKRLLSRDGYQRSFFYTGATVVRPPDSGSTHRIVVLQPPPPSVAQFQTPGEYR